MRLQEQVVIVTGGGSGLGKAIVERFVSEGSNVAVLDRDEARLADLRAELGDAILTFAGDVRSMGQVQQAVNNTVKHFGRLDCAIGNAGIWDYNRKLDDAEADQLEAAFSEVFDINVLGCITLAKAAIEPLVRSRGSMVFTVSNAGFDPAGGGVLYTASKHAVVGVIRQLAHELAPAIRVNGVAPGPIDTQLSGPVSLGMDGRSIHDLKMPEKVGGNMAIGRVPETKEYTGAFVHLASREDAGPTTGTILKADCGIGVRGIGVAAVGAGLLDKYGADNR
ncbi:MAG: 3-(cis-5,6-dihydroxycyclohexa-1,3-dien-1-yl)propanoate dehydrogenase [Pseudomonadota bacterium]